MGDANLKRRRWERKQLARGRCATCGARRLSKRSMRSCATCLRRDRDRKHNALDDHATRSNFRIEFLVAVAIRLAIQVYKEPKYVAWADGWLSGKDRSREAAYAADAATSAAYDAAAYAAYDAAYAAAAATSAAAWAKSSIKRSLQLGAKVSEIDRVTGLLSEDRDVFQAA